jgi:translation initiation factor 6 (eIF-6)
MNTDILLQILIGDVILSAIISAVFVLVSNRASAQEKQQLEREMLFMKDHMSMEIERLETKLDALKDLLLENGKTNEFLNVLHLAEKERPPNGKS